MISEISATVQFWGKDFSPKKAEDATDIVFNQKIEVGDLGDTGKFKGKPTPYGSASLEAPIGTDDVDKIMKIYNILKGRIERMYEFGLEKAHFHIGYFYKDQCNCSLSKQEIKAISDLGIDFLFSCYDVSDDT